MENTYMKIEMCESLIYSWLRHVKKCQIVQKNWTVSPKWETLKNEELEKNVYNLINELHENIKLDIWGKSSLEQTIKQAESDALGIKINHKGNVEKLYAVDVAFHKDRLLYGSGTNDTVARLLKKYIRTAICVYISFGKVDANIIFATPKSRNKVNERIPLLLEQLKESLKDKLEVNYNFEFIVDDDFKNNILDSVIDISNVVNDTNELFLRSLQLQNIFSNKGKPTK